jgi:transmembrane sensor
MAKRLSSREVDDRAAIWAARVDAGILSAEEKAELSLWTDEDPRHLGAFAKANAIMAYSHRIKTLSPNFNLGNHASESTPIVSRRVVLSGSVAAAGIIAAGLFHTAIREALTEKSFATQIGETRLVPLDDGSLVTLNTDSKIVVSYSEERRDIKLIHGEALFDVAKNKNRPFVVDADGTQVRAVGTSFSVSMLPDKPVEVFVREGIVELNRPGVSVAPPVRLVANNRAIAPENAPIETGAVDPAVLTRALSWRVGRLAFEGDSLKDAAAAFARYSDTRIEIDDPIIANKTITGLFVSNDPIGFSEAVAQSFSLHADVAGKVVRISR